jgi:small conductance mechanosensitive channel
MASPNPLAPFLGAPASAPPHRAGPPISDRIHEVVVGGPDAWTPLLTSLGHEALRLLIGLGLLIVTLWMSKWAANIARNTIGRIGSRGPGHKPDAVLQDFVSSLARYMVIIVGVIAVLQQIGVQTTSVLAVLGGLTLTIGLALQGGLSNVAAGMMLLLLRPYRIGDRVVITGVQGVVRGLDLFVTRVHDYDNSVVFIPNAKAFGDVIVNLSMLENRRIVMDFNIDYDDVVDLALCLMIEAAKAERRVVAKPAPWAKVTAVGDRVTVTLRAWTSPDGYADTRFDLIKSILERFRREGLSRSEQLPLWSAGDKAAQEKALAAREDPKAGEASTSEGNVRVNRGKGRSVEAE